MRESVQLDIVGDIHVDFEDTRIVAVTAKSLQGLIPVRLNGRRVVANTSMPYHEIQWIGSVVRRQWWLLFPGISFTLLAPTWAYADYGNWGRFTVFIAWFVLFGLLPLFFFRRGRRYLGIATADQIVVFPMDRKRKKVARMLGLLRQSCTSPETEWDLGDSYFSNPDSWDNRPATGQGFNWQRRAHIGTLLGLWGFAALLKNTGGPTAGIVAGVIAWSVIATVVLWVSYALYRKIRGKGNHDQIKS